MDALDFMVDRDQHMRPLEYDLSENFNELLRYMQDIGILDNVPVGITSESEIALISDAYSAPPRALSVYGKSTQDGTPTPDAPQPILSVDDLSLALHGANLLDAFNDPSNPDKNCISSGNGTVPYAYDSTEGGYYTTNHRAFELSRTFEAGTHLTLSADIKIRNGSTSTYSYAILQRYANDWPVPAFRSDYSKSTWRHVEGVLTVPSNGVVGFTTYTDILIRNVQIQYGSTATAYEPYQGATIQLYDGTLYSLPDGTKDELHLSYLQPSTREGWAWYSREVVRRVCAIDLGTLTWTTQYSGTQQKWTATFPDATSAAWLTASYFMCSGYKALGSQAISATFSEDAIAHRANSARTVMVHDLRFVADTTPEQFRAAVDGVIWQYKLATPVTTTLDPIELPTLPAPTCTVWCDGGSSTPTLVLEYVRDTNATIAELSEAIADIVSG